MIYHYVQFSGQFEFFPLFSQMTEAKEVNHIHQNISPFCLSFMNRVIVAVTVADR